MTQQVQVDAMAHGGDGIGRLDGKAVFIGGALPGETVMIDELDDRGSWGRARLADLIEASPDRTTAPCAVFADCGGCQWQHADYQAQLRYKREVVAGQLEHLGRIEDPPVAPVVAPGRPYSYRNRMAFYIDDRGRPGQYRAKSHVVVPAEECLLLVEPLADLYRRLGDLSGVTKLVIRHGTRTGETLAVVEGELPDHVDDWNADVVHRTRAGLQAIIGSDHLHEIVAGVKFRITGASFFQVNTPGADELVALVSESIRPNSDDVMLDAYAGGGLFSATVGRQAGRVLAVERGAVAGSDLRHNLAMAQVDNVEIVDGRVEDVVADPVGEWTLAICDPPRTGLGQAGVVGITHPRPRAIAYVSCDPASFARDVGHFANQGYRLERATPVDLFPQTYHVETVGLLVRDGEAAKLANE